MNYNINWEKINSLYKITLVTKTPLSDKEANRLGYYTLGSVSYYRTNTISWCFNEGSQYIPEYLFNLHREQLQKNTINNFNMKISTSGDIKVKRRLSSSQYLKVAIEALKNFNQDMYMTYTPYQKVKVK